MRNALFFSVDRNMFPPAVFAAQTARAHSRANPFDIFIAVPENSIEPAWIEWAERNVGVHVKEVSGLVERVGLVRTANKLLPPSACYRLYFDVFVPSPFDRVLYLDGDIRVAGDISRLFDLDLGQHAVAACPDAVIMGLRHDTSSWVSRYLKQLQFDPSALYFNTGVMVIDRQRWGAQQLGERIMAELRANVLACIAVDQSAANRLLRGAFQPISPVWNFQMQIAPHGELGEAVEPAVIHYSGWQKPWQAAKWPHGPAETAHYQEFARSSPWPQFASLGEGEAAWSGPAEIGYQIPTVAQYQASMLTLDFADVQQGLTLPGPLRARYETQTL